jgi:hypothetical protein
MTAATRYELRCKREGVNGSASVIAVVTDTVTDKAADPVEVTRGNLRDAAARLAGMMPGTNAADVERELEAALSGDDALEPVAIGQLWQNDPHLREPVIDGLLRRGQVGNLISTSKSYKTYLVLNLAVTSATGRTWLERFPTVGGKVLLIDLELQPPDISRRMHDIVSAMHVAPSDVAGRVEVVSLRGRAVSIDRIEKWLLSVAPRTYSLVIIDPLYKTYPAGFDENSNPQMTNLYRRFERLAEHLDCGLVVVHHASKGSQADKSVIDVGAGAGAQARSPDAHVVLRQHEADDAVVFDARVRSFPPVEPMALEWHYPLWQRSLSLDPAQLRPGRRGRNADKPQPQPKPEKVVWDVPMFVKKFITEAPQNEDAVVLAAAKEKVGTTLAKRLLRAAEDLRVVYRWHYGPKAKVRFSTIEQSVTQTTERA